ncbi:MAG: hypothetical protein P8J32_05180 [bacterium]|nr:hypothetical protein [bacterium]
MRTLVLCKETKILKQDLETGARVFMWQTMVIANIDFTEHDAGEDTAQWLNRLRAHLELTLGPKLAHTVRRAYIQNTDLATFGRLSNHLVITHGPWVVIVEEEVDLTTLDLAKEYRSGGRVFKIHRLQAPLARRCCQHE